MLGVRWSTETTRTEDVDIAAETHLVIDMPNRKVNLHKALVESDLGFLEVPGLNRTSPSTRFRIRDGELSVDILTPMIARASSKPVHIASLNTYAEPVRFLDYLLSDAQPAVIVARAGILVNVLSPARYALHKLVLAERRIAAFQTKTTEDVFQAEQLLAVLLRERPADVRLAWRAVGKQPRKFAEQLRAGFARLSSETRASLKAVIKMR